MQIALIADIVCCLDSKTILCTVYKTCNSIRGIFCCALIEEVTAGTAVNIILF